MNKFIICFLLVTYFVKASELSSVEQYDLLLNQTVQDDSIKSKLDLQKIKSSKFVSKVGLVSLDMVYLFHPKMKNYNYLMDSFFINIPKNLSISLAFYLKNKLVEYKKFKRKYLKKQTQYKRAFKKINLELNQLREAFLNVNTNNSTDNFRDEEQKYWDRRYKLEQKKENLKKTFTSWLKENDKDFLMSEKNRDLQFLKIVQEVEKIIKKISIKNSINFVFNIDSDINHTKSKLKLPKRDLFWQEYNDYSSLLQDELFFNYEKRGTNEQYYKSLSSHLSYYPQLKNSFSQNFKKMAFVGKSQNITKQVLDILFDKYRYSKRLKAKLLRVLFKFSNKDK
ncbi:MAG: hypothetical protein COB02_02580 [Candidatus Cloacimonadota bacterium]|nr:MAG: hypothetical protein COB02_02580 [Candidatus Cloacimonadota bacterium]